MASNSHTASRSRFIPLCVPEIRGNEWKYVKECLDTNWVSSVGSYVDRFERDVAQYVGAKYAVATVNGTAALHIALLIAGVGSEDEVLTSTLTFIAPANAIRYVSAWPVFMDAEPAYWQMDPQKVVDFLEKECHWRDGRLSNKSSGRRVKAILPVHLLGHPVDMDPIIEAARKFDLTVIEDATESLGAAYKGTMVGRFGDLSCFSFNGNKLITTGGGGMIVTDNEELATKAKYLTTQAKDHPIEYIHHEVGYNYRLPNMLAAMGVAQMEVLDEYIAAKRHIASTYRSALETIPGIVCMGEAPWASSTYWMYTVLIDEDRYGMDSRQLLNRLAERGIQVRPLWQPLHLSRAHENCQAYQCACSEDLFRQALSLPCSVGISRDEQEVVCASIAECPR
jgi:perosamine synthetase